MRYKRRPDVMLAVLATYPAQPWPESSTSLRRRARPVAPTARRNVGRPSSARCPEGAAFLVNSGNAMPSQAARERRAVVALCRAVPPARAFRKAECSPRPLAFQLESALAP